MRRIGAREFLHEIRMTLDGITSACEENILRCYVVNRSHGFHNLSPLISLEV